jgi:hypothetical protein
MKTTTRNQFCKEIDKNVKVYTNSFDPLIDENGKIIAIPPSASSCSTTEECGKSKETCPYGYFKTLVVKK